MFYLDIQEREYLKARKVVNEFSNQVHLKDPNDDLAKSLIVVGGKTTRIQSTGWTLAELCGSILGSSESAEGAQVYDDKLLNVQSRDLASVCKKFLKGFPDYCEDSPPDLRSVLKAVTKANSGIQIHKEDTRTEKAKTYFHKICGSLSSHQDLCAMIPSGDKYVCLLTGSLSMIIKASVRHQKITGEVSDALDKIADDATSWRNTLKNHEDNVQVQQLVAKLYGIVFELPTSIVKWVSRSSGIRALKSIGISFESEIQDKRSRIDKLSQNLDRVCRIASEGLMKNFTTKDDLNNAVAEVQTKLALCLGQMTKELGQTLQSALLYQAQTFFRLEPSCTETSGLDNANTETNKSTLPGDGNICVKNSIYLNFLRFLDDYTSSDILPKLIQQAQDLKVRRIGKEGLEKKL